MFKHYFEKIHNVEVWPIISLTIFFVFFVGLMVYDDAIITPSDFKNENH